jgi:hypothetical protein
MSNENWPSRGRGLSESREELETKQRKLKAFIRSHAEAIFNALEHPPSGVEVPYSHMAHRFADKILALVPAAESVNQVAQPAIFSDMVHDLRYALEGPEAFNNLPNREKLLQLVEEIQNLCW